MEKLSDPVSKFEKYLRCESDSERSELLQNAIEGCLVDLPVRNESWLWYFLGSVPSKLEKSKLAQNFRVPQTPDSRWCASAFLLSDGDQDVLSNTINAFTFSQNRILAHRLMPLFMLPDKPQRILYCLARFAEEAKDYRFSSFLTGFLSEDLSDAFLARSFNALYRLGIKDRQALNVAISLVQTHVLATNMDRKAAVSAILYICFAGNCEDLERLRTISDKVNIPELKRLLIWGLDYCNQTGKNGFSKEDALNFIIRESEKSEMLFTGYGGFSEQTIFTALKVRIKKLTESKSKDKEVSFINLVKFVLGLGNSDCINLLANDEYMGLASISKNFSTENSRKIKSIWFDYNPVFSDTYVSFSRDIDHLENNFEIQKEAFTLCCNSDFFSTDSYSKNLSQAIKSNKKPLVEHLLISELICMERLVLSINHKIRSFIPESKVAKNLTMGSGEFELAVQEAENTFFKHLKFFPSDDLDIELSSKLFSVAIGGYFSDTFLEKLIGKIGLTKHAWTFSALSLTAQRLDREVSHKLVQNEIQFLISGIQSGALAEEVFLDRMISCYTAILWSAVRFSYSLTNEMRSALFEIAQQVQGILDTIEASESNTFEISEDNLNTLPEEEIDDGISADWKGKIAKDKPLLRWNALVQVMCSSIQEIPDISEMTQKTSIFRECEKTLKDSLRIAPHVDKRWVVKALAHLGNLGVEASEDAIKTLLYQGIQHVDPEFVSLTIKELLPLKHPRTQQTLVRCVGRSNVPDELKLLILDEIPLNNPQEILQELRTLELLRMPQHIDDAVRDAVGRVATLVDIESIASKDESKQKFHSQDIDLIIKKQLPSWERLGVDIRSALRTAEMILIQSKDWGNEAVDLSPIVNMHCKAVELTMRDLLEPHTDAMIRKGILSRKLDLLGYSRPIPEKMQIFEDYLGNFPIIKTIPYFSKFKLRKMLRAVCLYRPGKRFTLDGPKAFALLFLAASRKKCSFGLEGVFDTGLPSDSELFDFVKLIHSLQDSRNRAVHEGLTWDAQDEIDSLRKQAYRIIEICLNIDSNLQLAGKTKKAS